MQIKVLGASGSEIPGHNSPAFLIDDFLLLDAGTVSISLDDEAQCHITHIFLTHAHLDHIKGIPFLVDNIVSMSQACQLTILSGPEVLADLKGNIFNNRIWPDFTTIPSPDRPVMRYQEIGTEKPLELRGYSILATEVDHAVPAYGYIICNAASDCLVYTGDTGPTEHIWKRMEGRRVKGLIIEVSFPNELEALALTSGHLTPALLGAEFAKMPIKPETTYITHLKPFYRKQIEAQLAELSGIEVVLLSDHMELTL
ncbi:MAG: MBL fold metallo-hydrolase [Syntrophobacteraceae bacterium]